ncbi:MAG: ATP-binding protein [Lachnoclostridium sp.]|nr:ATP-binding protein [Lachnospira sp.]MCM1248343.1 ATP-binding protein [Lachnoclostridium sp.]
MFAGHDDEIRMLNRYFDGVDSQILVVYGAKGVGKTELLQEFTANKESVYYAARACSDREQRYQWGCELREAGYQLPEYPEYRDILEILLPEQTQKQILALDEFQHLIKGGSHFFEELVQFLENRRMSRPVMTVLLSSAPGWVENSMVDCMGGLATYLTGFLKLKELSFPAIRELFPEYGMRDAICCYSVLGGIPGFWNNFDQNMSAKENIIHNIISKESRLYNEMAYYLAEELREPAVYNTILAAIAAGRGKLNDIYRHTGFSRAKISVYLKNLMELDLVEKIYAGVYRITVPYVRFYFRFLFPFQSCLERLSPEEFYEKKIAEALEAYIGESYGMICRQMTEKELQAGNPAMEWIGKNYTLDLVTVDGDNQRMVASCIYDRELTGKDYKELLKQAKRAKVRVDRAVLFGERGFDKELLRLNKRGKVELRHLNEM